MFKYGLKKAIRLIIVLLGVSILTFSFTAWIQGNPAEIVLGHSGIDPTIEDIKALEKEMGIDQSLPVQYINWMKKVVVLDFGNSYITGAPVVEEIGYRLPATLSLTVGAFLIMLVISVSVGVTVVVLRKSFISNIIDGITFIFMGVPGFVLGLVLAYIISVKFLFLPMVGNKTLQHYILPLMTLAIPMSCRYIRIIKTNLIDVLGEDYIFLLRTKGVRERVILLGNALKNAFIPVANLMGISFGSLFGGSIVVENIFSWPGLGNYLMNSINSRDYPVILAYVMLMATVFVFANYIVDMIVCFLDPRIKFQEGEKQ